VESSENQLPLSPGLSHEVSQLAQKHGHFKIIMGSAPGVGKTYRMLLEAHGLKKLNVDVVVGYFEPHGRKETIALLEGLEVIPRQKIEYKGIIVEEMDTQAIIQRNPQFVLVDELAHTNISGSKHEKRYEDVQEILSNGISVISTLNIQHIESLNDIVSHITGVKVHERLPDWVIDKCDEVVLVDISAEELQDRLKKGKIYAPEKIEQSLNHFFKKGNLVALRELALREVANSVEEQAENDPVYCPIEPTGIHERIMVCISTHPNSQRLIRRGCRIASRLNGELVVVFVKLKGRTLPEVYKQSLEKHKKLVQELKGKYLEVEAEDIAQGLIKEAKDLKVTQIIVGEGLKSPGFLSFMKPPIPYQIFQRMSNIDIYIIGQGRDF